MKTKTKFDDMLDEIMEALDANKENLDIHEPVEVVYGFFNVLGSEIYEENNVLGGITIPAVAMIGKKSSRIYLVSLKALLENHNNETLEDDKDED